MSYGNDDQFDVSKILSNLRLFKNCWQNAAKDISDPRQEIHSIDFALIRGAAASPANRQLFLPDEDRDLNLAGANLLLGCKKFGENLPFKVVISIPTMYEFAFWAARFAERIRQAETATIQNAWLYDRVAQMVERGIEATMLNSKNIPDEFEKAVREILSLLPPISGKPIWQKMLEDIRQASFFGFGNFFDASDYRTTKGQIRKNADLLYDQISVSRTKRDGEQDYSFNFRNKMDALNLAISDGLASARQSDYKTNFVGAFPRADISSEAMNIVRRSHAPPWEVLAKIAAVSRGGDTTNQQIEYLRSCVREAEFWITELQRFPISTPSVLASTQRGLGFFWQSKARPLTEPMTYSEKLDNSGSGHEAENSLNGKKIS